VRIRQHSNGCYLGQIVKSVGIAFAAGPSFQWNILNYGQITNNVRLQDLVRRRLRPRTQGRRSQLKKRAAM
jgi:hypothetical protein